ncbi:hypothetical protein, partial [Bifidobacterium breve]|uniref:hypothetical protein n=1 Tax=Bifidobacterium breve TaxID=1685 RepID=UPI0015E10191
VTDAALGNADALKKIEAAANASASSFEEADAKYGGTEGLVKYRQAARDVLDAVGGQNKALEEGVSKANDMNEAMG